MMECVSTFEQLFEKMDEADQKRAISDDAHRQALFSWYLSPALFGSIPDDPFSEEFKAFQLKIYERLTGEMYQLANEETPFDFEHELRWPFPYGTRSADTVGTHVMGYGWLIKNMELAPESRVLEVGSGFGALTVHLAGIGYDVTCLDVNAAMLEFTKARTAHLPTPIHTICGDMAQVKIAGSFDAIIFNASFHHSLEHRKTIERMAELLTPDGIIAFTAEPIVVEETAFLPYPWGLRLDGLSVYCICKYGWMELGFEESYFIQVLNDAGWKLSRRSLGFTGHTDVWIARKTGADYTPSPYETHAKALERQTYALEDQIGRLNEVIAGYERGRFMQLMKWVGRLRS